MAAHDRFRRTRLACYAAYVVQAVVNNFAPLLFVAFSVAYGIPLSRMALLVTFNFGTQLCVDALSAVFVDRIGYRRTVILAHLCAALGMGGLAFFPTVFPDPFIGLLLASFLYAIGGGAIEVVVSPLIEACPSEGKSAAMSLLHSFYSWGQLFVIGVSTLFFAAAGIDLWPVLSYLWAALAALNGFFFFFVPVVEPKSDGQKTMSFRELFSRRLFWLFLLLMVCAGAAELAVCQWASAFLERNVGVPQTVGDLLGPCLFALFMGLSRVLYSLLSKKISLRVSIAGSGVLCVLSYLLISLGHSPAMIFIGCALCGFSVGILWPGTYSLAAARLPRGGTAMFALLALAGDLGCTLGPSAVGAIAAVAGEDLSVGILAVTVFPLLLVLGAVLLGRTRSDHTAGADSAPEE